MARRRTQRAIQKKSKISRKQRGGEVKYIPAHYWFNTKGYTVKTHEEAIDNYNFYNSYSKSSSVCEILNKENIPLNWSSTEDAYASKIVKNMFFSAAYLLSKVGTWDSDENDATKAGTIISTYLPIICLCIGYTPHHSHTAEMRGVKRKIVESDYCTRYQCPYCRKLVPIVYLGSHIKSRACTQFGVTNPGKYPDASSFGPMYTKTLDELYEVYPPGSEWANSPEPLSEENSLEPPSKKPRVKRVFTTP